ncbi:protein kinase [Streptomyces sp. NPDC056049]|uniref:serine/threonine-protein kinase n=1 Tax=Streptomyces sp. NPDC056049 TaxID=3345693 RepID=UPI0035D741A2
MAGRDPQGTEGLPAAGDVLAGRYLVGRVLRGGMGVVCLCRDLSDDRPVAVKTLLPGKEGDIELRRGFLQEATLWSRIPAHPHIVTVERLFRDGPDDLPYLVLEFVAAAPGYDDASLAARARRDGPLPLGEALGYALDVARGMGHTARAVHGFVHRDLKPGNILITEDGSAKVTDFGIAVAYRSIGAEVLLHDPRWADGAGTPYYMAPEQWEPGRRVDLRTDVYAFGAIVHELLTGRTVVSGANVWELCGAHISGQAALVPLPESWPPALRSLLARCLATDPAGRPASWDEVERALTDAWIQAAGPGGPDPSHGGGTDSGSAVRAPSAIERAHAAFEFGVSAHAIGDHVRAGHHYREALGHARTAGDVLLQAELWERIGVGLLTAGRRGEALSCLDRGVALLREAGEPRALSSLLSSRAHAHGGMGRPDEARADAEEAVRLLEGDGDEDGSGLTLARLTLARSLLDARRPRDARPHVERALAWARAAGDRRLEADALSDLGESDRMLGDLAAAAVSYRSAVELSRSVADLFGVTRGLLQEGNVRIALPGGVPAAFDRWYEGLELAYESGFAPLYARLAHRLAEQLEVLARTRRHLGEHEAALGLARRAARAHRELDGGDTGPGAAALDLVLRLEQRRQLLRAHPGFAELGEQRAEFGPAAAFVKRTERHFTGDGSKRP